MAGSRVAVQALVSGRVQGVWFRQSCAEQARAAGVTGWARNLDDGRVEVCLEGPRPAVERVLSWCRAGPPGASVTAVDIRDVPAAGLDRFEVR